MAPQALAVVATLLSFSPHGSRIELKLDRGSAEFVWLTPATFHFRRTLSGPLAPPIVEEPRTVELETEETAAAVRMRSKYLEVEIRKSGVLLTVRRRDGTPLTADLTEPRESGLGVEWDRQAAPDTAFYGLGARTDMRFDLRGKVWPADLPFLISTAGYGESHLGSGAFRFDFTAPDRYRIHAPSVDYRFHFGPTARKIVEIEYDYRGEPQKWKASTARFPTWTGLRDTMLRIVHGALSGMLEPEFDLAAYSTAPAELKERARQLGSLVRNVLPGPVALTGFRRQLDSFLLAYMVDRDTHGYPLWHPLPFQFPADPECANHADEFLFGDELLAAPIYQPGGRREVYLPPGQWTDLETNQHFPGRQTITVESDSLPLFGRNGTIMPLNTPTGLLLHYFPSLGGEFHILESDYSGWTALHASPAADVIRLQIESKKLRTYEWVVHHVDEPSALESEGRKLTRAAAETALGNNTWFYDRRSRNLRVRVRVAQGEDCIVDVSF
jgi:hypothetical protein